jgi:hypothetical protein
MTDREKLIELMMKTFPNVSGDRGYYACCSDELIANGVTVQKKGEWIKDEIISEHYGWFCSKCCTHFLERTAYCSWCGADMRGDS